MALKKKILYKASPASPKKKVIEQYEHKRVAVKIVDDRGIESLKIIEVV